MSKVVNPQDFPHRVLVRSYKEAQTHWVWDRYGSPAIGDLDGPWYCDWHVLPSLEIGGHMGIMAWNFKDEEAARLFKIEWAEQLVDNQ